MVEENGKHVIKRGQQMIDSKVAFDELSRYVDRNKLVVDFPNNRMDYEGFQKWYENQSNSFTGVHNIHEIKVWKEGNEIVIFAPITWVAYDREGKTVMLYPDVTIRVDKDSHLVVFYGCTDRNEKA